MTPKIGTEKIEKEYGIENYFAHSIMPLDLRRDIDYIDPSRFYEDELNLQND